MQCSNFFTPHLAWLNGNPSPPPGQQNQLRFLLTSNRDEANHFVFFVAGNFGLEGDNLLVAQADVLFNDRVNGTQSFDVNQPESNRIQLSVPDGPLERHELSGNNLIARYSTIECRDNGLLVCTSDFTREIVVLSLEHVLGTVIL